MRAELKRKSTRTVHGNKVVRLRIDIPYHDIADGEGEIDDILEWLDIHVDREVSFSIGPFEDENQTDLDGTVYVPSEDTYESPNESGIDPGEEQRSEFDLEE